MPPISVYRVGDLHFVRDGHHRVSVARAQGRTHHIICMDDNVRPEAYWPCFQAMASSFLMRRAEQAER